MESRAAILKGAVITGERFLVVRTWENGAQCLQVIESATTPQTARAACETLHTHDEQNGRDDCYEVRRRCELAVIWTNLQCGLPYDHTGACA